MKLSQMFNDTEEIFLELKGQQVKGSLLLQREEFCDEVEDKTAFVFSCTDNDYKQCFFDEEY